MTDTSVKVIITDIRVEEVNLNNSLKDKTSITLRLKGIEYLPQTKIFESLYLCHLLV